MERSGSFGSTFLKSSPRDDKTKVIVRTFDIPARNKTKVCSALQSQGNKKKMTKVFTSRSESVRNSKLSQYVIPPVTRVYPGRKAKTNQTATIQKSASDVLSPSVPHEVCDLNLLSSSMPLVEIVSLTNCEEVPQSVLPEKTVLLVPHEARKEKALESNVSCNLAKKITLKNVPDGFLGGSAEIVDSQLVGDKKIVVIRRKMNPEAVSNRLKNVLTNSSKNSCFNSEKQHKVIPHVEQQPSVIQTDTDNSTFVDAKNLIKAQFSSLEGMWSRSESDTSNTDKQAVHCVPDLSNYMLLDLHKESAYGCNGTKDEGQLHKNPLEECTVDLEGKYVLVPNNKIPKYDETDASQSTLKRKLIPGNLDHPHIGHITEKLTSGNIEPRKLSSTNVELQIDTACTEENSNVILSNVKTSDHLCRVDSPRHLLDPNSAISKISLPNLIQNISTNVSVMPQQNVNSDLYRKRAKIALQYQQEIKKAKVLPRVLRTIQRPAGTVQVMDIATQTSLFSLVEPGRIVEMHLKRSPNDCENGAINFEGAKQNMISISTSQITLSNQKTMNSIDSSVHNQSKYSISCVRKSNEEEINSVSSKRMRINSRDCDSLNSHSDDFVCSNLSSDNQINMCRLGPQINITNVDPQEKNALGPLNIKDKLMLACKKLTEKFSSTNLKQIEEKVIRKAYLDFKMSLVQDDDGNLPLHHDVMDKDVMKVRKQLHILAAQKQTVNVKNKMGETPLHLAVICKVSEIVQDLIKWGADLSLQDNNGDTALHIAILWGDETCFKILMENIEPNNPLLDKTNDNGYSPLHLCALNNKENEAKILIMKRADINLRDRKSGRTPLFHAVERGNIKMCRTLVDLGASTTISNFSGQSPLNASEISLGAPGTGKHTEEELYSSLCQFLRQTTLAKDYLREEGGNYQNQMNVNVLEVNEMEQDNGLSPNLWNRNCDILQIPEGMEISYKYNNR